MKEKAHAQDAPLQALLARAARLVAAVAAFATASPSYAAGSYSIGSGQAAPQGTPVAMQVCTDPTTGVVTACNAISATASVTGFTPSASGARMTQLSVLVTDSSQTLPTGAEVLVFNTDTTNPIYCNVNGVAATTSDAKIPANSWLALTPPTGVTVLHCIATGGTVLANGLGGSGLATGSGGGGGSGSGGGSVNLTAVGGSSISIGSATSGNSLPVVIASDQAAVAVKQATASNLNATVIGAGTAGTANAGVETVQGIASMTPVQVSQATASSLNATVVGDAASGSAVAGNPVLIGGSDGTDARTISTNASGQQVVVGAGTAGSGSGGVVSVQGIASGTQLPVSVASGGIASGAVASGAIASGAIASGAYAAGSVSAGAFVSGSILSGACATGCIADLAIAQAGSITGVKGNLVMGSVTTSAPSYTTAQTDPLSLDTAGNLRVNVAAGSAGNAAAGATGSAVPADGGYTALNNGGTLIGWVGDASGRGIVAGAGTAGTATGGVLTIQGVASMTPLLTTVTSPLGSTTQAASVAVALDTVDSANIAAGVATPGSAVVTNSIQMAGSDGTDARTVLTDSSGRQAVIGAAATGAAVAGNPVLTAGSDGTDARTFSANAAGSAVVAGRTATGSALADNPVLVAGSDGTDVRSLSTNASGQAVVVGAGTAGTPSGGVITAQGSTATGSALASNPILMGGSDGTDVRNIATNASGDQLVAGRTATGSALADNPVLMAGSDGTDVRNLSTNASGQAVVVGAGTAGTPSGGVLTAQGSTATGSALASNPLLVGASDGTDVRNIAANSSGQLVVVGAGTSGSPAGGILTAQGSTATGSSVSSNPLLAGASDGTDVRNISSDAGGRLIPGQNCTSVINVSQTATTDVHTSTAKLHICSVVLVSATAQNIGLDEGTGTTCETSGTALIAVSSTSAATATMAVAANGGFSAISGVPWLQTSTAADHLCVVQSSTGNVSGTITYSDY